MSLPASRTLWEEGREPGHAVVALGVALALTAAAADLMLTGRIDWLFDLGFVLVCSALALAVRPGDFFTVSVLPPLLMLATFVLLAATRSEALTGGDGGAPRAVLDGLALHSTALVVGYAAALSILVARQRVAVARSSSERSGGLSRSGPGRRLPA